MDHHCCRSSSQAAFSSGVRGRKKNQTNAQMALQTFFICHSLSLSTVRKVLQARRTG